MTQQTTPTYTPPPAPTGGEPTPQRPRTPWRQLGIVGGSVLGLFILLGTIGAIAGPNPPAPEPVPSSPQAAITTWRDHGGLDRITAMGTDLTAMSQAASASDVPGIKTACTSLQTDVESAQAYAPIPDATGQADWATALAQTARASTDCIASTDRLDVALLEQSVGELKAATAAIGRVNDRLLALR